MSELNVRTVKVDGPTTLLGVDVRLVRIEAQRCRQLCGANAESLQAIGQPDKVQVAGRTVALCLDGSLIRPQSVS